MSSIEPNFINVKTEPKPTPENKKPKQGRNVITIRTDSPKRTKKRKNIALIDDNPKPKPRKTSGTQTITIPTDSPKRTKKWKNIALIDDNTKPKQTSGTKTIIIPTDSPKRTKKWKKLALTDDKSAGTMVISVFDPKETKCHILEHWQAYTPLQIVNLMRKMYTNIGTLSSQLSNLKTLLSSQTPSPSADFLDALKLRKSEYKALREDYREKRDKEGFNLAVVSNADILVSQALEMLTSNDFRVLWPAVVLCSGLRPIEILTVDIKPGPTQKHPHDSWWVCISKWAKKGENVKIAKNRDFCRDHPLLCPAWIWCRAIKIIRAHFNQHKLTKRQLHQRYNKYWLQLLVKGYPQLVKPTHVLLRRFYAKYSFIYFRNEFENVISENSYTSWVLGHTSMEPALSYTNLHIKNAGKLNLFQIGMNLKLPASNSTMALTSTSNDSTSVNKKLKMHA